MADVTFVRTRTYYQPYDDLFKLSELAGYDTCYIDEIDPSDANKVYIYSPDNGETINGWPHARARIIHLQMEWVLDLKPYDLLPGVSERWTGDAFHARQINARHVPIGSHPCLNPDAKFDPLHVFDGDIQKTYDVAFMAYTDVYRRKRIKDELEARGLRIAPNGWGNERHSSLLQSRCIVHVHQWEQIPTIAPLRWCIAAAYGLPIISESVNDRRPFAAGDFMTCDYDALADTVARELADRENGRLESYGYNLRNYLCRVLTFRESVERAL